MAEGGSSTANVIEQLQSIISSPGSWDQLNIDDQQNQAQYDSALADYKACERLAAPFMDPRGQAALAELKRRTIEQPTYPWQSMGMDELIPYGCGREGQNSIVREIERSISVVKEGPPKAPGDDDGSEEG